MEIASLRTMPSSLSHARAAFFLPTNARCMLLAACKTLAHGLDATLWGATQRNRPKIACRLASVVHRSLSDRRHRWHHV